jgi:purine-binding chemotaxis protein CheW
MARFRSESDGFKMAQDQQYVTFGIDREIFAIPVDMVQEILDLQPISRLPRAPDYLLGLMDVRGAGMPIIDLRVKFGLPPVEPTNRTRVIILESTGAAYPAIGLVADCVFEVTNLGGLDLQPPPALGRKWRSDCVTGIGRRGDDFVIVLELEKLLDTDAAFAQVAAVA